MTSRRNVLNVYEIITCVGLPLDLETFAWFTYLLLSQGPLYHPHDHLICDHELQQHLLHHKEGLNFHQIQYYHHHIRHQKQKVSLLEV